MKDEVDLEIEGRYKMKEIVMNMNGLSEEGFRNRMNNDPYFRNAFEVLVNLFVEAKF